MDICTYPFSLAPIPTEHMLYRLERTLSVCTIFGGSATWYTTHVCSTVLINNCTFLSIIGVITLGKCVHRTPSGVRERHTCIGLMKSKNFK
jgi:hypothetical protein